MIGRESGKRKREGERERERERGEEEKGHTINELCIIVLLLGLSLLGFIIFSFNLKTML